MSKVLWTNNSPKSGFSEQNITILNDTDYDYIMLIYDAHVPYENFCTYFFKKPSEQYNLPYCQSLWANSRAELRERYISRKSSTNYYFSSGRVNGEQNNYVSVPIQIIGIRNI